MCIRIDVKAGNYNVGTEVQTTIKELCDITLDLKNSKFVKYILILQMILEH